MSTGKRALLTLVSLTVAAAIWLPCVHFLFWPDVRQYRRPTGMTPVARELAARHRVLVYERKTVVFD